MNMNNRFSVTFLSVLCLLCGYYWELGHSNQEDNFIRMMAKPGGLRDCLHGSQNSAMLDNLARFAVQEHNKKQNALLEFVRVVEAKEQVVAGKLYHLTLVAMDAGNEVMYKAKVWVKPWMNFKQLEEFKHVGSGSSFTASDLGIKQGVSYA